MYSGRGKLAPGTQISVEVCAQVVELAEADNPYWYQVEYADGRREVVSVARISKYSDDLRMFEEADGSIALLQSRLTREGAHKLYERLGVILAD